MFHALNSLARLRRDQGSSLLAVIGIMAVFAVISITIIGTTMSTMSATTSTRAGVQAQAAAEAGIDLTLAEMPATVCDGETTKRRENPTFKAVVTYLNADGDPSECSTAKQLVIRSDGSATNRSITSGSTQNSRSVVAVYEMDAMQTIVERPRPGIYSWNGVTFDQSSFIASGDLPDIHIVEQSFICEDTTVDANVLVADPESKVVVKNNCAVKGTVTAREIEVHAGGSIDGDQLLSDTPAVVPDWADLTYDSAAATWPGFTKLILDPRKKKCTAIDVQELIKPYEGEKILVDARLCPSGLILRDDSNDNENNDSNGKTDWRLFGDLVIVAPSFETKKKFTVSSESPVNLWLITPSGAESSGGGESMGTTNRPSCNGSAAESTFRGTTMGDSVRALIYTPCMVNLTSETFWRGQIYAGKVTVTGSTLDYAEVEDANLGPALWGDRTTVVVETTTRLGDRVQIRDVD